MKNIVFGTLIALFTMSLTNVQAQATGAQKAEIGQLVQNWHDGLGKADLAGLEAQYSEDAIFFPTFINTANNVADRKTFLQALINKKPTAAITSQNVRHFGELATCSGTWTFDVLNAEGQKEKKDVRYLFVFQKKAGKWLIIEQHVSGFPQKK